MALVRINGAVKFFDCNSLKITPISSGKWSISIDDGYRKATIIGGRKSGGDSREWFVHCPEIYGDHWLPVNSMVAAIRAVTSV